MVNLINVCRQRVGRANSTELPAATRVCGLSLLEIWYEFYKQWARSLRISREIKAVFGPISERGGGGGSNKYKSNETVDRGAGGGGGSGKGQVETVAFPSQPDDRKHSGPFNMIIDDARTRDRERLDVSRERGNRFAILGTSREPKREQENRGAGICRRKITAMQRERGRNALVNFADPRDRAIRPRDSRPAL